MVMKKGMIFFMSAAVVVLLVSCGTGGLKGNTKDESKTESAFKDEANYETKMIALDQNEALLIANSLQYHNNAGSTEEVTAFLDEKENIVKLEETSLDASTQTYAKVTFYLENGKKFATKAIIQEQALNVPIYKEVITYYDKSEKPLYAKMRQSQYEIELENLAFEATKAVNVSASRAIRALNQEQEFQTTFQGLAYDGTLKYIIVGDPDPEGFASTLSVQYQEGDIKKLFQDEEGYLNVPLEVQYERMIDQSGMEFQVLISVKIKK
jgi:hypothetical protein